MHVNMTAEYLYLVVYHFISYKQQNHSGNKMSEKMFSGLARYYNVC